MRIQRLYVETNFSGKIRAFAATSGENFRRYDSITESSLLRLERLSFRDSVDMTVNLSYACQRLTVVYWRKQ